MLPLLAPATPPPHLLKTSTLQIHVEASSEEGWLALLEAMMQAELRKNSHDLRSMDQRALARAEQGPAQGQRWTQSPVLARLGEWQLDLSPDAD